MKADVARYLAVGFIGVIGIVGLHCAFFLLYDPRDAEADHALPVAITRPAAVRGEATLLFAGDTAETDAALPLLAERGFEYPFSLTVDLIRDADLAIVNAEAPITDGGRRFPIYKDYIYRAPLRSADALAWAGFDILELANNHMTDYGDEGIADTIAAATRAQLTTVGAGADAAAARRGVVATVGEVHIGLLNYCENQFLWRLYVDQFARRHHPGVAALMAADLARDIARLRPLVDVLVVSFHIGTSYGPPERATLRWSERAIELGADLVVNHHPHLAHPIALHRGRPILLSLGNYAFGTPGRPELHVGYLALAHVAGKRLDRIELIPIAVQNAQVHFRPAPLIGDELDGALEQLRAASAPFGARVQIARGRGMVELGER